MKSQSKRWNVYHLREGDLKNYKGMSLTKKRPVLVISDASNLINKCLVVELGSKKNNDNHILWHTYFSKKHKCEKESWIKPDCVHTVNRWYLTDVKRSHDQVKLSDEIKQQIITYINSIVNEK